MARKATSAKAKQVETLRHDEAKRKNIPTAEHESVLHKEAKDPIRVAYERRNRDLDPQLVWRGKDEQDWSDLVVPAPPLYIQEKVHPKALIDDLLRQTREQQHESGELAADLFSDFNGIPKGVDKTEFYRHEQNWSNRMILGDSLQVMASLAEREGLRGKVQCIYFDPPYGIKFNSNFQWSTTSRDVKDGNAAHITREPEQVKAFRDTWRDGIHSYLTYLRDRLTVARDLLTESGSIFVQIGDENAHSVRSLLDEVFGRKNYCGQIAFAKTSGQTSGLLASTFDYLLWFARARDQVKFRQIFEARGQFENPQERYVFVETPRGAMIDISVAQKSGQEPIPEGRVVKLIDTTSQSGSESSRQPFTFQRHTFVPPGSRGWSTHGQGLLRVGSAGYLHKQGKHIWWKQYRPPVSYRARSLFWRDTVSNAFGDERLYVVQTNTTAIEHCVIMTTDPGDLVIDPTCGSGSTASVCEEWGRRWITIDTSRVAVSLLPPRRQSRRSSEGSRDHQVCTVRTANTRRHPARLRLRTRPTHHT
jgi:adenine-specific DNA-methyltransferase